MKRFFLNLQPTDLASPVWIRLGVGLIFLTQGILKYTDPHWGVVRFVHIGFPFPEFTALFVGTFEMLCGLMVTVGLLTRLASVPLLIVNLTAIGTTKIPELFREAEGFWYMVSDARTDAAMFTGILLLLSVGAGRVSLDAMLARRRGTFLHRGPREESSARA